MPLELAIAVFVFVVVIVLASVGAFGDFASWKMFVVAHRSVIDLYDDDGHKIDVSEELHPSQLSVTVEELPLLLEYARVMRGWNAHGEAHISGPGGLTTVIVERTRVTDVVRE